MKKRIFLSIVLFVFLCPFCRAEEGASVELPILMYHNISKDAAKLGKYVITPGELASDLQYLKEQGYESVTVADLIAFVHDGVPLPEKPVMLTFDDGDYAMERYALPLLETYQMKAVMSVIGKITDEYSAGGRTDIHYPNLTWAQINKLLDSGYFEIQSHTYDLHKGCGVRQKAQEPDALYKRRLCCDLQKMNERIEEMTEHKATAIVYPFGHYSSSTTEIIRELGFAASMNCRERMNVLEQGNPDCLYGLGRFLRPHGTAACRILAAV